MKNAPHHDPRRRPGEESASSLPELYKVVGRLYGALSRRYLQAPGGLGSRREEVVHDAVVRIWLSWSKKVGANLLSPTNIDPPIPARYAQTVFRNLVIDQLRSYHAVENIEGVRDLLSVDPEPDFVFADLLRSILGKLKKNERDVVRLRFIDGRSFEYIADTLGTTPGSARKTLSRAKRRLRRELDGLL